MANKITLKQFEVTLETKIRLKGRIKDEPLHTRYTVYAKTAKGALKAVRDAGYTGKPVAVVLKKR